MMSSKIKKYYPYRKERAKQFCAHRGVSALIPENTIPSFAAALAMGADQIEFDVRLTKDGKLIVSHDETLDRISDGTGNIDNYNLQELREFNVGAKYNWTVPLCTPEEIFEQFANKIIFNIHVKEHGENGYVIEELLKLAIKYKACESVYFAGSPNELEWMQKIAPDIPRVAIQLPDDKIDILEMAQKYGCCGVQFWRDMLDASLIQEMHDNEIFCNLFYADTEKDYEKYFDMGIDTLLTNRMDIAAHYKKDM